MRQITPDIYLIEGLRASNVYLLVAPEGLTLVDCGLRGEAGKITTQLARAGHAVTGLRQVVITHAHMDHTGSAAEIVRLSGAKVLVHKDEVPYIEGAASLPAKSGLDRAVSWLSAKIMPAPPAVKVDTILEDGAIIPGTGGFVALHTPGHTPGHICLYHPERRILFCGDALFNRHPLTGKPGLREPMAVVSVDPAQARASIRKLAALDVEVLLSGHGEPIMEKAGTEIKKIKI
jgi:glyoxylase-like metal-dependent hydrolase (beta-lactamase superfamily II)